MDEEEFAGLSPDGLAPTTIATTDEDFDPDADPDEDGDPFGDELPDPDADPEAHLSAALTAGEGVPETQAEVAAFTGRFQASDNPFLARLEETLGAEITQDLVQALRFEQVKAQRAGAVAGGHLQQAMTVAPGLFEGASRYQISEFINSVPADQQGTAEAVLLATLTPALTHAREKGDVVGALNMIKKGLGVAASAAPAAPKAPSAPAPRVPSPGSRGAAPTSPPKQAARGSRALRFLNTLTGDPESAKRWAKELG